MRRMPRAAALVLAALAATTASAQRGTVVAMKDAKGQSVGTATVAPSDGGVVIALDLAGLPPGLHALHVHRTAACEPPDFESAGPHFNPGMKKHGTRNPDGPHAGDLDNVTAAADGTVRTKVTSAGVSLDSGARSLFANGGTALVIHAVADDRKSDPAGNAGARIACGVIARPSGSSRE